MITTMTDHSLFDLWTAPAETKSFEATALLDGRERPRAGQRERGFREGGRRGSPSSGPGRQ